MVINKKALALAEFTKWVELHIKGDEKGEAQLYLNKLFQAFGWPGLKEAGATCEERVKTFGGGTSFADLVWKPVVVIEMKRRGTDLAKHYRQAFDYWTRLVPRRPRYAVLCNFDEFWIYDFESQLDTPVDKVNLDVLPQRYLPLNFLFPGDETPIFGNHQEEVTRQAADKIATCINSLIARDVERALAQRFILQTLMALFAQNIGLLEQFTVTRLLEECKKPNDTYDLLGGLFVAMNTKTGVTGGRYKGIGYFNGGLYADPAHVELNATELDLLRDAAQFNWALVRPEIFGTIFEHSLGAEERHAFGAHYTNVVDIMKIVGPTIVDPWSDRIEAANTLTALRALLARIESFTVLDPACGSGNFLYIAYREVKRLEARIHERMASEYKSVDERQRTFGFVTAKNFFGMDISPFAIDLSKVTMMLAHKLSIDELHIREEALPLDNLDSNFRAADALINSDGSRASWFKTDVIIGNPPFLGAKNFKRDHSAVYVNAVRRVYVEVPGMADICVYWMRRAHDELKPCTPEDPMAGRAGLVGTQNVRNGASRVGGLDWIVKDGTIVEAVENQPWSGEADVNVSIVNWVKSQNGELIPKKRRLWHDTPLAAGEKRPRAKKGQGPAQKQYDLTFKFVAQINSALSDRVDVSGAKQLACNRNPQCVFQGVTPGYDGFVLRRDAAMNLVREEPRAKVLLKPYLIGRELNSGNSSAKRVLIDAYGLDLTALAGYPKTFEHLKVHVLPKVIAKLAKEKEKQSDMVDARGEHLQRWWTFWAQRIELRKWLLGHTRVLAASRTQRAPFLFQFVQSNIALGDKLQLFAFDDDYSFGILQSGAHCAWYASRASRLKNEIDYNYSSDDVFGTFPWPQQPSSDTIVEVARAARALRKVRQSSVASGTGIRALYATLLVPGANSLRDAHDALDAAVVKAYGFAPGADLVAQLLNLNFRVAALIAAGKPVLGPGIPLSFEDRDSLASSDMVGVQF